MISTGVLQRLGIWFTHRILKLGITIFELNLLPDFLARWGMRRLLETNLYEKDVERQRESFMAFVDSLRVKPIAENTADANDQHYELPAAFFLPIMGEHLKYSSCIFPPGFRPARPPHATPPRTPGPGCTVPPSPGPRSNAPSASAPECTHQHNSRCKQNASSPRTNPHSPVPRAQREIGRAHV